MAYEILNTAQVTPHRLHAALRLVARLGKPSEEELKELLQPAEITKNQGEDEVQTAVKNVLRAAVVCGLLREIPERKAFRLAVDPTGIESLESFRTAMRNRLLSVADENEANFLLNLYGAWYAVQGERIFGFTQHDFANRFNSEIYPGAEPRPFNTTKLNGWQTWAAFLGWGWPFSPSSRRELLMPDATGRLAPLLPSLLPADGREVRFTVFADQLAQVCPELDGGVLFERCWQASQSRSRGTNLSLMLSTALRALHDAEEITLTYRADAEQTWHLFPADGHQLNRRISHIRRGRG